jgi:RNA recognition motif-containing protein
MVPLDVKKCLILLPFLVDCRVFLMYAHLIMDQKKNNYQGKRRVNSRTNLAQQEDSIRRTVYVSDIDHQVTEEQLAALFINCGQVVDCRVCGDPNSVLRFAFVEFTDEESARAALSLAGTMLGYYPVRVLPSKTAIAPVNPTFLPRVGNVYISSLPRRCYFVIGKHY